MKAPSTGLSTQLPGPSWPASSPSTLWGWGAAPASLSLSRSSCVPVTTLCCRISEIPERSLGETSTSFPGRGLGPRALVPWGQGSPLCRSRPRARDLGWYKGKAFSPSRGARPGHGSRQGAQAQHGVGRWGVCAALQPLHFPT